MIHGPVLTESLCLQVRVAFEEKLQVVDTKRKERVMDEVIRSALTEEDHVARLREEKRKLLIEQKRLKAMKDMQKSDANLRKYRASERASERERARGREIIFSDRIPDCGFQSERRTCWRSARGSGSCRRSFQVRSARRWWRGRRPRSRESSRR